MYTVRLLRGEFADDKAKEELIDWAVKDFYELEELLQYFQPAAETAVGKGAGY